MNPIEAIKSRLARYAHVKYESTETSIFVDPVSEQGFTVGFTLEGDHYTVYFNGWHENFEDQEDALNRFALGLSQDCRLKEYSRGEFAYKWTVETWEEGKWIEAGTTGLFLFPFWKSPTVNCLQNDLIEKQPGSN
jgi:hypothetical protein